MRLRPVFATLLFLLAGNAGAQLLPGGPALPRLPVGGDLVGDTLHTLDDTAARTPLADLRHLRIGGLLRSERARVDVDPHGEPVLRGEFLLMDADPATLAAVQAAGFTATVQPDDGLGLGLVVVRDSRARSATSAMRDLRRAAPRAQFAFQHIYLPAGLANGVAAPVPKDDATLRVGLVDGGVDAHDPAFAGLQLQSHGCTTPRADVHGTAVARRLAGGARGTLYAANLWCGDAVGRATLGLVDALAWMARERVPVINISLVGPDNPVLARAVATLVARGHVLIAAVGNDGPAAPPLYPASYPGVIGVSGVDAKLRALPEAASGPQVDFVASGLDGDGRHALRGTSFAAPIVARIAAMRVATPAPGAGTQVEAALAAQARDLGAPGRDPRYGDGLVGAMPLQGSP